MSTLVATAHITLFDSADQRPILYYKLSATQPATPTSATLSTWSTTPPTPTTTAFTWLSVVYFDSLGKFLSAATPGISSGPTGAQGVRSCLYRGPLTANPSSEELNDCYWDNSATGGYIKYYDGSGWVMADSTWVGYFDALSLSFNDMIAWYKTNGGTSYSLSMFIENLMGYSLFFQKFYGREVTMDADGVLKSANYTESGGIPSAGYKFVSRTGELFAVAAQLFNANIKGTFEHDALKTYAEDTGTSVSLAAPTKERFDLADLYALAASLTVEAVYSCVASINSISYTSMIRSIYADMPITVFSLNTPSSDFVSSLPDATTYTINIRKDGNYSLIYYNYAYNGTAYYYSYHMTWYRNGRQISGGATTDTGAQFDIELNALDVLTCVVLIYRSRNGTYQLLSKLLYINFDYPKNVLFFWGITGSGLTYTLYLTTLPFSGYCSQPTIITSPITFDSTSATYKKYASITTILSAIASFTLGATYTMSSGSLVLNSITYTILNITRNASSITFGLQNGSTTSTVTLYYDTTEYTSTGWYIIGACSFVVANQLACIATKHIIPKDDASYDMGVASSKRYRNAYLSGTVTCGALTTTSQRSKKKQIKPLKVDALSLVRDTPLFTYRLKQEKASDNLHVGIIADDSHELLAGKEHDHFDVQNGLAIALKAIQQIADRLEKLECR